MGDHRITGPYRANQAFETYPTAIEAIDILANIMVNETEAFFRMMPSDHLLSSPPPLTFCMAEQGAQYLVYSDSGQPFILDTRTEGGVDAAPQYNVTWFDAVDGQHVIRMSQKVTGESILKLQPPSANKHWVLLLIKT